MHTSSESLSQLYKTVLPAVMDGIANSYGQDFLENITVQLAQSISADFAFIGRVSDDRRSVQTLALCQGNKIIPNFSYALESTPCEIVLERGTSVYPERVAEFYPEDGLLLEMGIEGYLGTALLDRNDNVLGLVVGLYQSPMLDTRNNKALFELFSGRIAAEIESTENVYALQSLNDELESRIEARTAALAAANNNLEAFAHSVSHDLKAPVRAIQGIGQIICEDFSDGLPAQVKDYLQMIETNAAQMRRLIDDMLALAQTKEADIQRQRIDVSSLCDDIITNLQQLEPTRVTDIHIQPHIYVDGDEGLCHILFTNILSNAWKYSSTQDCCQISVSQCRDKNRLAINIQDNGVGFDAANAPDIFAMFQRVHSDDEFEGTGVGLATVKSILDKHKADIAVESQLGLGAKFTLYWPMDLH